MLHKNRILALLLALILTLTASGCAKKETPAEASAELAPSLPQIVRGDRLLRRSPGRYQYAAAQLDIFPLAWKFDI